MGSGRRDFDELAAKLEKHIDRLPDYAQRAQEKLQRYFPPEQGQRATVRPNPLRRPVAQAAPFASVPVFAEARAKWAQWNTPAAKLERRKRRASRALTLWILLTILCGLYAVAAGTGLIVATSSAQYGSVAAALVTATLGVRSGLRLRQLNRTELPPEAARPRRLPPVKSVARAPMERLAECEESLAELLRQLSASSLVAGESVEDARKTAGEAAAALRALADRVQAVERARDSAPAADRKALDSAVKNLADQLNEGLDDYSGLVAAAGRAVAAGGHGMQQSKEALTDATDRLAGLAIALREVS
ncbi:phage shock envelope stress response protein PspM [Amycolatopsis sp.]|uniref:phage shock envelope stress response protein PspM n=1 Tax=Amycolatopsis sp. TaxID=37632 RepID=UPI002CCFE439|nr:hypothetical protein [Amycolatopsis sp.]HVV10408.1 hypothetical protein [Amycolatopsis sp.]